MFLSICIPNYNRPKELLRLLKTIDVSNKDLIEVVICEDRSPMMLEVRSIVNEFKKNSNYLINYSENESNLGYDKNIRQCMLNAKGEWIVYMGNDDEFVPGSLDKLLQFLKNNDDLGYVLKSHYYIHKNNKKELFRYYKGDTFFDPGFNAYVQMFRKSVFISGFTIKRDLATPYLKDDFDGTLLFQLYLLAEVCLRYKSAYFDTPLTQQYDEGFPEFGNSESEKGLYTPGIKTVENSLYFLKGYFKITRYIDDCHGINSTHTIKLDMSKYFYPSLAIQRDKGVFVFFKYFLELNKLGFNITIYYYIYFLALLFFGRNICDNVIRILKNVLKRTPHL